MHDVYEYGDIYKKAKRYQVLAENVAVVEHAETQGAAGGVKHAEKQVPRAP